MIAKLNNLYRILTQAIKSHLSSQVSVFRLYFTNYMKLFTGIVAKSSTAPYFIN